METLVKICKVHGEVSGEDVYKREYKNSNKKPTIHCRICHKKRCKEDYERRRILQGSRRNSSWVDGNMVCQKHGPLEEKDIGIHAQKQNVSGVQVRCKKCTSESNWRRDKYCKKHGVLADDKIKANGRCKLCHRESANRKRNNNRAWFNEKIKEDRQIGRAHV